MAKNDCNEDGWSLGLGATNTDHCDLSCKQRCMKCWMYYFSAMLCFKEANVNFTNPNVQ